MALRNLEECKKMKVVMRTALKSEQTVFDPSKLFNPEMSSFSWAMDPRPPPWVSQRMGAVDLRDLQTPMALVNSVGSMGQIALGDYVEFAYRVD